MAVRVDPYRQMRFLVEIEGMVMAGFSHCDLPAASSTVIEYREGNEPPTPRKLPGLNAYGPLVLETGVTDRSVELFEWRSLVERGTMDEARRSVAVTLLDSTGQPAARWEFREAWPSQYEAPRLSATAEEVAIERLVVVHEGFGRARLDEPEEGDDDVDPVMELSKGALPRHTSTTGSTVRPSKKESRPAGTADEEPEET